MLYLLNKDVRTVRWNGEPLHEVTSAIVKEIMNGDFTLTVKYPISDSGIYQLIQEDMLIKAPTPVLGAQLFRIKKPVEYNDHLEITAYHISDDVMQRSITPVSVTSQSCGMTLSRMVQNTKTALGDFSFNSDIQDRRTFNTTETETLYSILLDGKHSIVGTWGGELVRDNFAMTVKKSRGENRGVVITTHKNLKNYQRTKNSQNVVTRIHAKSTFKPEGAEKETTIRVTVDSPLINSYPYINEKEYENNNAKTVEELQKWAQSKFSNEGIDKVSDAIKIQAYELDGQVVHMGDTVNLKSWKHNVDAFKKAIAYEFDALKEEYISLTFDDKAGIGGSRASGGLSSAADAILGVTESAQEIALEKALQNADLDFDHKAGLLRQEISDDIELAKARAEEVKRELSDTINQRFNSFDNGPLKETKRKAEEALRNAGASTLLAQEAKRIELDSVARLEAFKSQTTSAQTALSGELDTLKRTIVNDIRPKQAQAETEIAKQVEALSRTKNELAGASTLLAQEAKRIELDSVARLEAFKSQTTSAQTALSGDLDALKRTIANDIRPKQAQAETEIAKQVEALSRTKNELAGVKSAQATYEETTTRRLSELTNLANGKASKSELTQTAEELSSKIASVQASGRNLFLNSLFKQDISKTGIWTTSTYTATIDSESKYLGHKALKIIGLNPSGRDGGNPKVTYPALGQFGKVIPGSTTNQDVTISFYAKANKNGIMLRSRLGNIGYKTGNVTLSTEIKRYVVHIPKGWTNESKQTTNEWLFNFNQEGTVWIWMPKFEISDVDTSYSEAPEDIEGQISTVESTFKQRANSLDAGVSRLTEGLRTKVDISALNVTAENIRQSVKSLETDTQNKLNQKLSQAEFEVRAGSIRQEILNATKDKADKTLVVSEVGKLREEFSKMKVGGRNLWIKSKTVGAVIEKLPENHVTGQKECYRLENNSTLTFNLEPDFSSRLYQKVTFSAWIKYENVVQGRNFWNVFNCFKHYLFRKNSETGVQSGPDYATLGMYKGSADWKYITFTYDYSEKTNFDQLKTSLRFNLEGATSGTAWVTGIKVEIGSVATDWSPAPEDADGLITEAKATFERTAQGLRTDLSAIQEYVNKDGQRQEALRTYSREESARQATAVRELVNRDFVGKATYQEDVKGINQRIEAVKTSANKDIASQIASYRQSVDGKFTDISSQITTYKQDVGGQISGLSNRLTSSEQGTTTQISNLSNRINSNKQGTDNQISNLKTQVATNKDNAERQMGRISDQVSANKANADSQFANVTNQLARKVETTDFQRVKETSKLYERILGNTENGIADKVARMALTNQLFQVEVAKNASNGQNLLKGTKDFSGGWKNKGA
ncbi:phage tail spike protein, partial [Streptococcus pneumoniae]